MNFVQNANAILSIFETASSFAERGIIRSNGLSIKVLGEDSNLTDWLEGNFAFIADHQQNPPSDVHTVSAISSDNWLREIISIFDSEQFKTQIYSRRGIIFYRIQVSSHVNIDYFPSLGCAWLTQQSGWVDKAPKAMIVYISSSRTPLTFQELRIGLVDIINRYFESHGWHTFHAGAVNSASPSKTLMIVGASSSGKTSLILNLLQQQFQFIANERMFCKLTNDVVRVKSFPQPINVGIGSALHNESLRDYVDRPDRCSYYQNQFEPARVWNTTKEDMAKLPDKLKFLPRELVAALSAPTPSSNAAVDAIIVPAIGNEPTTIAEVLTPEEIIKVLSENYFASANDQVYPRWLPIEYDYHAPQDPNPIIEKLSQLPAWRIRYNGSQTDSIVPALNKTALVQDLGT